MIEPISVTDSSSAWQTRLAAMQQQLTQQLFQSADANGDGTISRSEFESFYSKFTGAAAQTPVADEIFQQFDTPGAGQLNATQFAAALDQIVAQAQGNRPAHAAGAGGAPAPGASQDDASSAANTPAALLSELLSPASAQDVTAPSAPPQDAGSLEFIA